MRDENINLNIHCKDHSGDAFSYLLESIKGYKARNNKDIVYRFYRATYRKSWTMFWINNTSQHYKNVELNIRMALLTKPLRKFLEQRVIIPLNNFLKTVLYNE